MNMRIIEEDGKKFAMVPYSLYEKLSENSEMLEDVLSYDAAKARVKEYFPAKNVTYRILDGEHPVKVFREYRKMTQVILAKKARIARAYLSEIENGTKKGSIAVMKAIASALEVSLDSLV